MNLLTKTKGEMESNFCVHYVICHQENVPNFNKIFSQCLDHRGTRNSLTWRTEADGRDSPSKHKETLLNLGFCVSQVEAHVPCEDFNTSCRNIYRETWGFQYLTSQHLMSM